VLLAPAKPSTITIKRWPVVSASLTCDCSPMPAASLLHASSRPWQLARTESRVSNPEPLVSML